MRVHRQNLDLGEKKEQLVDQLRFYEDQFSEVNQKIEKVNEDYYAEHISDQERLEWVGKYMDRREAAVQGKQKVATDLARLGRYDLACEHLCEFSRKFSADVKGFSEAQKQALVDLLVERVELSDSPEGRAANALFRFDAKEIAAIMPGVEPVLGLKEPRTTVDEHVRTEGGASDSQGYFLLSFVTPVWLLREQSVPHSALRFVEAWEALVCRRARSSSCETRPPGGEQATAELFGRRLRGSTVPSSCLLDRIVRLRGDRYEHKLVIKVLCVPSLDDLRPVVTPAVDGDPDGVPVFLDLP